MYFVRLLRVKRKTREVVGKFVKRAALGRMSRALNALSHIAKKLNNKLLTCLTT